MKRLTIQTFHPTFYGLSSKSWLPLLLSLLGLFIITGYASSSSGINPLVMTSNSVENKNLEISTSYLLTVIKSGTGAGTVTSSPAGISCGTVCSSSFPLGTVATLTATAAPGSHFSGWSGACTGTWPSCIVYIGEARTVTASFVAVPNTLRIIKMNFIDSGDGLVTSDPPGINCGEDCSETYDLSTYVVLTAVAYPGSRFGGWSGACAGMMEPCTLLLESGYDMYIPFFKEETMMLFLPLMRR
jgi:hypothetical protein